MGPDRADHHLVPTTVDRESGFTLIELSAALAIIAVLIIIAMPMFQGVRDQSEETAAQAELRDALVPLKGHLMDGDPTLSLEDGMHAFSGNIVFDPTALNGIETQTAADGSICMWRIADTGQVFGVWTTPNGSDTMFTEQAALPSDCPDAVDTAGAGFAASW